MWGSTVHEGNTGRDKRGRRVHRKRVVLKLKPWRIACPAKSKFFLKSQLVFSVLLHRYINNIIDISHQISRCILIQSSLRRLISRHPDCLCWLAIARCPSDGVITYRSWPTSPCLPICINHSGDLTVTRQRRQRRGPDPGAENQATNPETGRRACQSDECAHSLPARNLILWWGQRV